MRVDTCDGICIAPHANVTVEQLEYEPFGFSRLRDLGRAFVAGERPPDGTTIERMAKPEARAPPCCQST